MKIGELSKLTGVSIPTIRLYERDRLIECAGRTTGRFRVFSEEHRQRLDFIKRVRNLGFSLENVRSLLAISDGGETDRESAIMRLRSEILSRQNDLKKIDAVLGLASRFSSPRCHIEATFDTED